MKAKITFLALICLAFVFLLALPGSAGTWSDGFEDGNLDGWGMIDPIPREKWGVEDGECSGQYTPAAPGTYSPLELKVENAASWKDYTITLKAKLVESFGRAGGGFCTFGITFRMPPGRIMATYQAFIDPESNEVDFYEGARKISVVPLPFDILEDTWYELKVIAEGEHFEFYINDELMGSFDDDSYPSGGIELGVSNTHVHFDDVVITGPEIPDGGPGGVRMSVHQENTLITTWGTLKQKP